jgi:hypothetical protein
VPLVEAFMEHFKGVEFNFTAPGYDLVVTTYDDLLALDAELIARGNTWFPTGSMVGGQNLGPWIWHNLALGILAESELESAFSQSKATANSIEWISFISGPSLVGGGGTKGLVEYLDDVLDSGNANYGYIPYKNVLGGYVTQAQALTRYTNLKNWYSARGHLWVASGAFYLYSKDTTAKIMELRAFEDHPDNGSQWLFLLDPDPVTPPAHKGAWIDRVTIKVITDEAAAVSQLQSNTLDAYPAGVTDPDLFETVKGDPGLHYYLSAGLFDEITFNPSGPFFPGTGKLNPFAIPAIREAMNWAIDRSHIAGEIYGGMGFERYTCIGTKTGDYINRYPALMEATEDAYEYDFDKADVAIETAMLAIPGVTRAGDGKYYYEEPA